MKSILEESKIDALSRMYIQLGVLIDFLHFEEAVDEKSAIVEIQKSIGGLIASVENSTELDTYKEEIEKVHSNVNVMFKLVRKAMFTDKKLTSILAYTNNFSDRFSNLLLPIITKKKV